MNSSLAHIMISFAGWAGDFSKKRLMARFGLFVGMMVLIQVGQCWASVGGTLIQIPVISANFSSGSSGNLYTVQGAAGCSASLNLSSPVGGKAWTATSSAAWVKLANTTGVTPATLQVALDASQLNTGLNQATITITVSDGAVTVPVNLQVDPLVVTVMHSDSATTKVYAISEAANVSGGATRAYLLEVDSLLKKITKVIQVGSEVFDFTVHHPDNRIYVPNSNTHSLLAVGLGSFAMERTYAIPPVVGGLPDSAVIYRVSAGGPNRLVVQAGDQRLAIFNTDTGTFLDSIYKYMGIGAFDPTGRYYYYGDYGISTTVIQKFDVGQDKLSLLKTNGSDGVDSFGSFAEVMSEDGNRVFWNGVVFKPDLTAEWTNGDIIFSASKDGRYAFSQTMIYDVETEQVVGRMPVSTKVSAFNTATGRLVVQNGSALGFYNPVGPGLLGEGQSPKNGVIVTAASELTWTAITGATGYRVYFGMSSGAVSGATRTSSEYLGEVTDPTRVLTSALLPGHTYYWRVDVEENDQVATGDVQTFRVETIVPSMGSVEVATLQGNAGYAVPIGLTSVEPGESWTASASAPWVTFKNNTGVTPATLQVTLDASQLSTGVNQATITITGSEGACDIPVDLQVDPLALTVMKSDPESEKVYAISEAGAGTDGSRAYLLEIDSRQRRIARMVSVGSDATDLAIHHGDNRIYVTNKSARSLLAVGLGDFTLDRTYLVPLVADPSYARKVSVYELAAGAPGRLMIEPKIDQGGDQSFMGILDTTTGKFVTALSCYDYYTGGGRYDPSERYYYQGALESVSGAGPYSIIKYDTTGDHFTYVKIAGSHRLDGYGNFSSGSRTIIVSDDGKRVFWNGAVYNADLNEEWLINADIFATTPDGDIAFGQQKIYDVGARNTLMPMPPYATYCAYNTISEELVVSDGSALRFYALNIGGALPTPVLSAGAIGYDSVEVTWTDTALESGVALQKRIVGTTDWVDVSSTIPAYSEATTASGLSRLTAYEFRLKANSPVATSTWSNIVTATTLVGPPIFDLPASSNLTVANGSPIHLVITASGDDNHYTVSGLPNGMSFDEVSHAIIGMSNVVGVYVVTVSATNDGGASSVQINLTIGATTPNAASGHYEGLTYGDTLAVLGTWKLDRTDNRFTGTFNALGGTLTFFGGFSATGEVRRTSVNFGKYNEVVFGTAIWDRAIDRITLTISISGYGTATTLDGTGFVSSWNATSHPYTKPGVFTAVMLPDTASTVNEPEGEGFLTFTISAAGVARVVGETALGEKVTWSGVAANNFSLPVYWQSGGSFLWGFITTVSDDPTLPPIAGALAWGEDPRPSRKAYGAGFTQQLNVLGNQFQGSSSVNGFFTNTTTPVLQLGGGGLTRIMKNLTQPFRLSGKGALLPPNNPYQVKLTINPKTGLVTGQAMVTDPSPSPKIKAAKRTIAFRGIMVRNADGAGTDAVGGYFLLSAWDKSVRSGWMEITAP